ncbi:taste receptor type 1 member 1-like isoform X2 [Echeneis naucrates]|uniref:taste receptor type 1 member 1-like isoform X2 n=1 Tax=Echeneis naucrates TaxID=173247 RepID=UPI001113AE05|nr:taste receptor type 1 member 1-like isoform X2 [Echeneis naucrates]
MKCPPSLWVMGSLLCALTQWTGATSEFQLEGDYVIGGLFGVHHVSAPVDHDRPEAIKCSRENLTESSHRRFQLMRFSVEEINNSTNLLPNVSLGYEIFDHCSDMHNFPAILHLISVNGSIQPWSEPHKNLSSVSKVIALVGTYTSPNALTAAPLFMTNLIPMVSYGASSSVFSRKQTFPSFFRTVHPNKDVIKVIVDIMLHFKWRWVAFLNVDDDYGNDGQKLFRENIKNTQICLAYTKALNHHTNHSKTLKQIEAQKINVIIVFAPEWTAEPLIQSAIQNNVTNKVWIAGDAWSLNKKLPTVKGIRNIGTVIGVAEPRMKIPGFSDFIYSSKSQSHFEDAAQQEFCNQVCDCSNLSAADILAADPSFSFPVYSAVYAIAHALHNVLECGAGTCNDNITVYPHMVLAELKKSNFTLLNHNIQFDENGDPNFGTYAIVFWNHTGDAQEVGNHTLHPSNKFFIDDAKIKWHTSETMNAPRDTLKSMLEDTNAASLATFVKMEAMSTAQRIPIHASTARTQSGLQKEAHPAVCGWWSTSHSQTLELY